MFIDTHCHLSVEDYKDIDVVMKENRENGVYKIIISGCSYESIIESLDLSKKYEDIFVTIGYHPSEVKTVDNNKLQFLEKMLKNKKVVGIGEVGLDYHYGKDDIEEQQKLFKYQLELAEKYQLPVVIHSRDATMDTINILKKYKVKGIIHCFSGSVETAKAYISMGFLLGIGGVLTFKNSNLYKVVESTGLDNIVLETDSPYLTPEPFRGKQNSSKYIPIIGKKVSDILNISVEEVAKITSNNASNIFDLT